MINKISYCKVQVSMYLHHVARRCSFECRHCCPATRTCTVVGSTMNCATHKRHISHILHDKNNNLHQQNDGKHVYQISHCTNLSKSSMASYEPHFFRRFGVNMTNNFKVYATNRQTHFYVFILPQCILCSRKRCTIGRKINNKWGFP